MTKQEAQEEVYKRYDMELLREVLRFSEKNPSRFTEDMEKESVDFYDVLEGLVEVTFQEGNRNGFT